MLAASSHAPEHCVLEPHEFALCCSAVDLSLSLLSLSLSLALSLALICFIAALRPSTENTEYRFARPWVRFVSHGIVHPPTPQKWGKPAHPLFAGLVACSGLVQEHEKGFMLDKSPENCAAKPALKCDALKHSASSCVH